MIVQASLSDSATLFGRTYKLVVVPANSTQALVYGNVSSSGQPLRCKFSVERDLTAHANKATITLTNLSLDSRQIISKGASFALSAGYINNMALLFYGKADKLQASREGANIDFTVECKDASDVLQYATIEKSYAEPTSLSVVLRDIVNAMQQSVGGVITGIRPGIAVMLPKKTLSRLHLTGTCASNLKRILKNTDIEWSIQNGRINFAPKNRPVTQVAVLLSEKTGLVDIPSVSADVVTLHSLMNPRLYPGAYVVLDSVNRQLSGNYKIRKTKHTGDTHGGEWLVECECVPLDKRNQPLPVAADLAKATPTATDTNYEAAEE